MLIERANDHISIHALLAESDTPARILSRLLEISIHALLAESDFRQNYECFQWIKFLSTLSLRRATALGLLGWLRVLISIHALLAESDWPGLSGPAISVAISIHALLAESDVGAS